MFLKSFKTVNIVLKDVKKSYNMASLNSHKNHMGSKKAQAPFYPLSVDER